MSAVLTAVMSKDLASVTHDVNTLTCSTWTLSPVTVRRLAHIVHITESTLIANYK